MESFYLHHHTDFRREQMLKKSLLSVITLLLATGAYSQYYSIGNNPFHLKWNQIRGSNYTVIFPDYYAPAARQIAGYIDTIQPYAGFGLSRKPNRIPIIIHPENLFSNGLVTWAPKRMELITSPPLDNFAVPWKKHLSIHEYRHVVQMSNLNRHFIRGASYLFGEQIVGVGAFLLPTWYFEGDAVLAETEMTFSGRGKQPEFSIGLRAILSENKKRFTMDKWLCGSFREYIPDQYTFGYHVVAGAQTRFGDDFWDKVVAYTSKYPFLGATTSLAIRKYGKTTTKRLVNSLFDELEAFWHEASNVPNSAAFIPVPAPKTYTIYQYPLPLDSVTVLSLKNDYDRPSRFVLTDRISGEEKVLAYTGTVSSRPVVSDGKLYWTEFSPSLFWEQKNHSVVRSLDIEGVAERFSRCERNPGTKRITPEKSHQDRFFVTPMGADRFAMMSYDRLNNAFIVITDARFRPLDEISLGPDMALNGMVWDEMSGQLVFIALDNDGMWLGAVDDIQRNVRRLTPPSYVALKNLSIDGGKLFYNSTGSGKDEIHLFDLATGEESRLTTSRYGSVSPGAYGQHAVFATYTRQGYLLAEQRIRPDSLIPVAFSKMPDDKLNPPYRPWNVMKIDTVNISAAEVTHPEKRFRRFPNMFHFHSWMPFSIDVDELINERSLDAGLGMTVLSQSLLNDMTLIAGYGWVKSSNLYRVNVSYDALPVKIGGSIEYGGGKQLLFSENDASYRLTNTHGLKNYFEARANLSMPFNVSSGRWINFFTPYAAMVHYNGLLYKEGAVFLDELEEGYQKMVYGASYTSYTRMAVKNLRPRWGYTVQLFGAANPFKSNFGHLYGAFVRGYLPGIGENHSLMLRGAVQYQKMDAFNFRQKPLFPRGCDFDFAPRNLYAVSADYKFPFAYPDGGIRDVIYFKRLSMEFFGDYARYTYRSHSGTFRNTHPYSYGGGIEMDFCPFGSSYDFTLNISVYKPSDRNHAVVSAGVGFTL